MGGIPTNNRFGSSTGGGVWNFGGAAGVVDLTDWQYTDALSEAQDEVAEGMADSQSELERQWQGRQPTSWQFPPLWRSFIDAAERDAHLIPLHLLPSALHGTAAGGLLLSRPVSAAVDLIAAGGFLAAGDPVGSAPEIELSKPVLRAQRPPRIAWNDIVPAAAMSWDDIRATVQETVKDPANLGTLKEMVVREFAKDPDLRILTDDRLDEYVTTMVDWTALQNKELFPVHIDPSFLATRFKFEVVLERFGVRPHDKPLSFGQMARDYGVRTLSRRIPLKNLIGLLERKSFSPGDGLRVGDKNPTARTSLSADTEELSPIEGFAVVVMPADALDLFSWSHANINWDFGRITPLSAMPDNMFELFLIHVAALGLQNNEIMFTQPVELDRFASVKYIVPEAERQRVLSEIEQLGIEPVNGVPWNEAIISASKVRSRAPDTKAITEAVMAASETALPKPLPQQAKDLMREMNDSWLKFKETLVEMIKGGNTGAAIADHLEANRPVWDSFIDRLREVRSKLKATEQTDEQLESELGRFSHDFVGKDIVITLNHAAPLKAGMENPDDFLKVINPHSYVIYHLVHNLVVKFQHLAASQGVRIAGHVITDDLMLAKGVSTEKTARVLENLVENAIKYSDRTKKDRRVDIMLLDEEDDHLKLVVEDNGIGMAPEFVVTLGNKPQRETRAQNPNGTKVTGTGSGWMIIAKYLRELGWEWRVESEIGRGTEVTISIPRKDVIDTWDDPEGIATELPKPEPGPARSPEASPPAIELSKVDPKADISVATPATESAVMRFIRPGLGVFGILPPRETYGEIELITSKKIHPINMVQVRRVLSRLKSSSVILELRRRLNELGWHRIGVKLIFEHDVKLMVGFDSLPGRALPDSEARDPAGMDVTLVINPGFISDITSRELDVCLEHELRHLLYHSLFEQVIERLRGLRSSGGDFFGPLFSDAMVHFLLRLHAWREGRKDYVNGDIKMTLDHELGVLSSINWYGPWLTGYVSAVVEKVFVYKAVGLPNKAEEVTERIKTIFRSRDYSSLMTGPTYAQGFGLQSLFSRGEYYLGRFFELAKELDKVAQTGEALPAGPIYTFAQEMWREDHLHFYGKVPRPY